VCICHAADVAIIVGLFLRIGCHRTRACCSSASIHGANLGGENLGIVSSPPALLFKIIACSHDLSMEGLVGLMMVLYVLSTMRSCSFLMCLSLPSGRE